MLGAAAWADAKLASPDMGQRWRTGYVRVSLTAGQQQLCSGGCGVALWSSRQGAAAWAGDGARDADLFAVESWGGAENPATM